MRKLRSACEAAKRNLSLHTSTTITIDSLYDGINFHASITRPQFEHLCQVHFHQCKATLDRALTDAKMKINDIHEVILTGGSSRIPCIEVSIRQYFGIGGHNNGSGPTISLSLNRDECVAEGAAIFAAILIGERSPLIKDLLLVDVTSTSLGLLTSDDIVTKIIPRNSPIPCKRHHLLSSSVDDQSALTIQVYEGEHDLADKCTQLGKYQCSIPLLPKGVPQVDLTFEVGHNGILTISAKTLAFGVSSTLEVKVNRSTLSDDEVKTMGVQHDTFMADQRAANRRADCHNHLQAYVTKVRSALRHHTTATPSSSFSSLSLRVPITSVVMNDIQRSCQQLESWLAGVGTTTEISEFTSKGDQFDSVISKIFY
jgi:heat shock protein 1/8